MIRLLHIFLLTAVHRLDTLFAAQLSPPWRILSWFLPWRLLPVRGTRGQRLRRALESIGPIAIKFGQALSTRPDLLPADLVEELGVLRDRAPPFPAEQAQAIVERALGKSTEQLFRHFSREPMASASIAQLHAARLHDGRQVVVKVLRPDVERAIQRDLRLLGAAARMLEALLPGVRRLKPVQVVEEYGAALLRETDLRIEAANTSRLRRNFPASELLYVPRVHWEYCRREVLVMERIRGLQVDDLPALRQCGADLRLLAERGAEIFFTQVFDHNFFHADMHPGNVYVDVENPRAPGYIALDCAVMGSLSDADLYYLARNLLAIFQQDYRLVAELHVECGWAPADTPVHELEAAVQAACEPIFSRPLGEIALAPLLVDLFATARRFDMEAQPSLVLLQKTLLQVEGLGRQLYPELDLWTIGRPFLERWLRRRYAPSALYRRLRRHLPGLLERLPEFPGLLLQELQAGETNRKQLQETARRLARLQARQRRQFRWGVGALLLLLLSLLLWRLFGA